MERSRQASHLASRSYRGGIPDLGGGDEVAGAGGGGGGVGAAVSGASAMARVSRHEETGRRDSGEGGAEAEGRTGGDSGAGAAWLCWTGRGCLDANALPFLGRVPSRSASSGRARETIGPVLLLALLVAACIPHAAAAVVGHLQSRQANQQVGEWQLLHTLCDKYRVL
jgi:hypothetical protein